MLLNKSVGKIPFGVTDYVRVDVLFVLGSVAVCFGFGCRRQQKRHAAAPPPAGMRRRMERKRQKLVEATTGWLETYPVPHVTARNTIPGLGKQVLWQNGTPK